MAIIIDISEYCNGGSGPLTWALFPNNTSGVSPLKLELEISDWAPFARFLARSAIIISVLGANASTFDQTEWIAWGQTVLGLGGVDYFMRRKGSSNE